MVSAIIAGFIATVVGGLTLALALGLATMARRYVLRHMQRQPDPGELIEYERDLKPGRNPPGQHHGSSGVRRSLVPGPARAQAPAADLDLRGKTLDDAYPLVENYLRRAHDGGLRWVRINHGDANGKVCRAIRNLLAQNPLVGTYETGHPDEGGEDVIVVHLAE